MYVIRLFVFSRFFSWSVGILSLRISRLIVYYWMKVLIHRQSSYVYDGFRWDVRKKFQERFSTTPTIRTILFFTMVTILHVDLYNICVFLDEFPTLCSSTRRIFVKRPFIGPVVESQKYYKFKKKTDKTCGFNPS